LLRICLTESLIASLLRICLLLPACCGFVWLTALLQVCRICLTESLIASLLRICLTKHHCNHVENCLTKHCNMLKIV
jgi:hypothetical protein